MSLNSATLPDSIPQSLPEWLDYMEAFHPRGQAGIELGLERIKVVSQKLGQTPFCPIITIAGTNGKGSTAAYLEAIFNAAGYLSGCYTSPHLLRYNERIRVKGGAVSDEALCLAFSRVEQARRETDTFLTYFEFGTLAAWEVFAAEECEVLILETGLGGRLDAVNLYPPTLSLITTIDLDHMDWLGHDRESIGREKSGIFRAGQPACCGDDHPPESVLAAASTLGTPLQYLGRDFGFQPDPENRFQWRYWGKTLEGAPVRRTLAYPGLRGTNQLRNAALVLAGLDQLAGHLPVSMQAIREGLIQTELPGRFQVLPGRPSIILDVAHNPQAARALAANLEGMGFFEKTYAVLGMLRDKDIPATLLPLKDKVNHWFLCTLDGERGLTAEALARQLSGLIPGDRISCHASPAEALAEAEKSAGENDRIVTFGSFHTIASALTHLGRG